MRIITRLLAVSAATLLALAGGAGPAVAKVRINPSAAELPARTQVPAEVDAEDRDVTGTRTRTDWWEEQRNGKDSAPKKATQKAPVETPADPDCVNQVLMGVTDTERQTGALLISRDRWFECRDPSFARAFSPELAVNEMLVALRLPDVTPQFGPSPSVNEWGMLPVGHPIWLWTAGPRTRSASVASQGVTFRLSATWVSTRFSMGDGVTVTCTSMSKYTDAVVPGTRSPSCGHVYSMPSLPKGEYPVTATATWRINWSVAGVSGSFRHAYSDTAQLPIGELQGLIVR